MRKRIIKIEFLFIMMTFICCSATSSVSSAKTYTRKEVNKKIKSLNKEIAKLNKEYNKQLKSEGGVPADYEKFVGSMVSIWDKNIYKSLVGNKYYYVNNPSVLSGGLLAAGYIRKTGATQTYYDDDGYRRTCYVVDAKKDPNTKSKKVLKKITKKKKKLKIYKNGLRQKIIFDKSEDNVKYVVGDKNKLLYYEEKYDDYIGDNSLNTIKWKSSNTNVVQVNSEGRITAVGGGTATITATLSISKKKASINITVLQKEISFKYSDLYMDGNNTFYMWISDLGVKLTPKSAKYDLEYYCYYGTEDVTANYIQKNRFGDYTDIKFDYDTKSGDYTVVVKDKISGITASCIIHYTGYVPEPEPTPEPTPKPTPDDDYDE